jgi:hypothetical protein
MIPIRKGDGTGLSAKGYSEVRKGDGTVLWRAIPGSGDLHARYDATEISASGGDNITSWTDETGNGHDLSSTTGQTYETSVINGNPVVRFDGTDDYMDVSFSAESAPNHVFAVVKYTSSPGDFSIWGALDVDTTSQNFLGTDGSDNWTLNGASGERIGGGTPDTSAHIWSGFFNTDTNTSTLRLDGSQVDSGDVGDVDADGITLGSDGPNDNHAPVDIGEVLVYPQDKSGIQSDVEDYLSNKWGITI